MRTPPKRTGTGVARGNSDISSEDRGAARLPIVALLLCALLAVALPLVCQALNLVDFFAFPLGYFMAAQGSLIALVVVGLISARWQDRRRPGTDS
jgi:putative solute:sodium symporter small subunit